jgi:hypothetical protein
MQMLRQVFERLTEERRIGFAGASVAGAGATWAALCLLLARGGHAPSVTLMPIAPERYYLWQAAFVVPVLAAQWLASAGLAHRAAKGKGSFTSMASALGPALAGPLIVAFLVPDLVAYAWGGFDALKILVRFSAPISLALTGWLATVAVRAASGRSTRRSLAVALLAILAPAAVASVFLR